MVQDELRIYSGYLLTPTDLQKAWQRNVWPANPSLYYDFGDQTGSTVFNYAATPQSPSTTDPFRATPKTTAGWLSTNPACLPQTTQIAILAPSSTPANTAASVTLQAQNMNGARVTTWTGYFLLLVSGHGTPQNQTVHVTNGQITVTVTDTVAETVTLSLYDDHNTGLTMTSTQSLTFFTSAWPPSVTAILSYVLRFDALQARRISWASAPSRRPRSTPT